MEREEDVQLIQRTLSGDDTAFGILFQRHQKSVHALIWRKIGDFHIAEDITQDTFLISPIPKQHLYPENPIIRPILTLIIRCQNV